MLLEITLLQRQHAFGLPPSGCESCTSVVQQYQRSNSVSGRYNQMQLPIAAQSRYIASLPQLPQNNWDASQTVLAEKHNPNDTQLNLHPNISSQCAVYPLRKNLVKPRSEDSLLNDSTECPCPFCQSQYDNFSVCSKTDRSTLYEVSSTYEDICPVCSHGKYFEMKSKQTSRTYFCSICKSDNIHQCGKSHICNYQSYSHQIIDDINGNYRRNQHCCYKNTCWLPKNSTCAVKKQPLAPPLPARCSSSETLCSTESCQSDAYLRMYKCLKDGEKKLSMLPATLKEFTFIFIFSHLNILILHSH